MGLRFNAARNQYVRGADVTDYAANGAIAVDAGVATISKPSAAAMTLVPPTAADTGAELSIIATTAFPHTVTITEGVAGKGAAFDVITFAAVGDSITLRAVALHWMPTAITGPVLS